MPSARWAWVPAALPAMVLLSGCVSTQRVAARARLVDARVLASQTLPAVVRANPEISVGAPIVIRGAAGSAVVVSLRNNASRVLTDLPISVGVRTRHGRLEYLNRTENLDYFSTHVAAIGPHDVVVWVLTTARPVSAGSQTFATVGFPQFHPSSHDELPRIAVSLRRDGAVSVTNDSAIPQYDVPVYAVAIHAGREVAAGEASVAHLGTHGHTSVSLTLLGDSRGAALRLIALPTIFS